MGIGSWLKRQLGGAESGSDVPPGSSLLDSALGREPQRSPALGEFDSRSYPQDLAELLRRREMVTSEVLSMNVTDRQARIDALPRLRELLRDYPLPLVYELLIHAYVDSGRLDEARGVAFAAQARREECVRSEHPEIRSEIDHLKSWTPAEVDRLEAERAKHRGDQ